MKKIRLLDCTLRDGGYVNNWNFGISEIYGIIHALENSGVDIVELGFLRDEQFNKDRTAFSKIENINALMNKKESVVYSAMIEAFNPYPLKKLALHVENGIDLIRVCIWKRCIDEHMQYCKDVMSKGYKISIQPSRVEQYNNDEFIDMLKRSNELNPYSVYVVDTWGTQSSKQIIHYLELADKYLDKDIKIGYHGHNNKLQALSCAQAAISLDMNHELCIDSSIMGMGRGAGNLNTEIIMDYMNEVCGCTYDVQQMIDAYNKYLKITYHHSPWGYSIYYYLTAIYGANPNFATYFEEKGYSEESLRSFLSTLNEQEKVVFDYAFVEERLKDMGRNCR